MGKKKGRKKQKQYSKNQFKQSVCSSCGLCPTGTDPKFCYAQYQESNDAFTSRVLPKLVKARYWFAETKLSGDMFDIERFEDTFCRTGICEDSMENWYDTQCTYCAGCFMEFRQQLLGTTAKQYTPKKHKHVAEPLPTFFHSPGKWVDALLKEMMDDFEPNHCGNMGTAPLGGVENSAGG